MQGDVRRLVIAIDGPSGSGKSTVARRVAARLGLRYLDTGAMYRAITATVLARGMDPQDGIAVAALAGRASIEISTDDAPARVTVDGVDVTGAIRGTAVTAAVSSISAIAEVRVAMVARQRQLIGSGGIVIEGRDIGTTVAPQADLKVFLTAAPAERAARRAQETSAPVAATQAAIAQRDRLDSSRTASPLAQAHDALVLDSTHLDADAVVTRVLAALGVEEARS